MAEVTLSLNKLQKLLQDNSYTLVALYCENEQVKFLEVRTPKIQKTFIIALPKKYKLESSSSYKSIDIYQDEEQSSRQLEYLTEIKGPLLECDLVSVSSFLLCSYKNNGDFTTFKFGKNDTEVDVAEEDSEDNGDTVNKLIKDVNAISEKVDPELKIEVNAVEGVAEEEHVEENAEEHAEEEHNDKEQPEDEKEEAVEIVFEDENGKTFDGEASGILEGEPVVVPETALEPKKVKIPKREAPSSNRQHGSVASFVPENLETLDIYLGLIYYSIDIDKFYKKANRKIDIEEDIISTYDIIDENENDLRSEKADNITELCAKLTLKVKEEVEKYRKEENHLKTQILKLSLVLDNAEKLKGKIDSDGTNKFLDSKPEINKLYNQTKTTFHDINLEILRNKDRIDDFLVQYQSALEEMLN